MKVNLRRSISNIIHRKAYITFLLPSYGSCLPFALYLQNSHVQLAKQQIQTEIKSSVGQLPAVTHPSDNFNAKRHHNERHHRQKQHYHQSYHENQRQQKQKQKQRQRFHWHHGQRVHHFYDHRNRWLLRRQRRQQQFTSWSVWSECGIDCVQRRERYCKVKRKCGHTKHIEERKCRQ